MFISVAVALAIIAFASFLFYGRQKHQYWASRGVWTPKVFPILGHTIGLFMAKKRWEYIDMIYCENKDKKYWGIYTNLTPSIFVTDPEILKLILVKDADSFVDRPFLKLGGKDNIFNENLTIVSGEKWKALRTIISPTFTSGKIKGTFPLVSESVETLLKNCSLKMEEDGFVDMKTMLGNYTLDVITNCALGIRVDCYTNKKSNFLNACYDLFNFTTFDVFKILLLIISDKLFYGLGLSISKSTLPVLVKSISETIKIRQESNVTRGDFLDLLLEALKNYEAKKESKYPMTMNTVVSSSIMFILAGYDTTSTTLSFATYLLANNTQCQDELRTELQEIMNSDGEINYQNLMDAKYLDACLFETLRMYGPFTILERKCTQDYKVPSHDLIIPKDMVVGIPSWSMQYDPQYWDEPKTFRPERFLPENKQNINQFAFYGFGQGPRNCVGMRFALMKAKLALAHLVLNFEMSLKPGVELGLTESFNILKLDSNGIPIIMEPVGHCDQDYSASDQQSD